MAKLDPHVWLDWVFAIASTLAVCGATITVILAARADGSTDYCYVTKESCGNDVYSLNGHRPWRKDRVHGYYPTHESALTTARQIGCQVR